MSDHPVTEQPEKSAPELEALLEYLKRTRGFDFTAYKRASLTRRVQKRLQAHRIERVADYLDFLEVHPEEFAELFNTILINVTNFFRDPPAWESLSKEIIPRLLERWDSKEPLRIWSAGCSAGQEAYTLAMVFAEHLGEEGLAQRVKIYGTDADEEALKEARRASYTVSQVQNVPDPLREKYFEVLNGRYCFRKELRRAVIFGRQDLLQDAPISRVDLLVCRNTLMYFNVEAQARVLSRFDFALNGGGFLFLGKADVLITRNSSFIAIDLKRRLFAKLSKARARDALVMAAEQESDLSANGTSNDSGRLRDMALESDPAAQIIVDAEGRLAVANAQARMLFNLGPSDIGRDLYELQLAYRPVELRALIDQAFAERRPVVQKEVEWTAAADETRFLNLMVLPLLEGGERMGVKLVLNDVTRLRQLQDQLRASRYELEASNEALHSSNEEFETTNEELQSTVEELETTNEELESTNEEMETMNEELQSTNEELHAMNEEMKKRADEVRQLNIFLESIMSSMREGMAVVDRDLQVTAWNNRAEDLWGVRAGEVLGKNLLNLDIGLPLEQIRRPIWDCLSGKAEHEELTVEATNRRGRAIRVKVGCSRLVGGADSTQGVIVIMEELNSEEG